MKCTFRKLKKSDGARYKRIRLRAFQESAFSFSESFEDEQTAPLEFFQNCLGTTDEHFTQGCFVETNELVGVATFKRDQRLKARHKGYIHTMYVSSEHRGKKIAQKILSDLIAEARSMDGLEQIHLWVLNPATSRAKTLYSKAGFETQGAVVRNDLKINGRYIDAEYMTLNLT